MISLLYHLHQAVPGSNVTLGIHSYCGSFCVLGIYPIRLVQYQTRALVKDSKALILIGGCFSLFGFS